MIPWFLAVLLLDHLIIALAMWAAYSVLYPCCTLAENSWYNSQSQGQNLGFEELAEFLSDHVEDEDEGEGRGQDGVVVQVLPPDAGSVRFKNFLTQSKYILLIKTIQKWKRLKTCLLIDK